MMKELVKVTGLDQYVKPLYENYQVWRAEPIQNVSVSDASAAFKVHSVSDLHWLKTEDIGGERVVIRDIIKEINQNEVFFDVGSNIGLYSVLISSLNENIQTFAFEPAKEVRNKCMSNRELNNQNFEIHNIALSDQESDGQIKNFDDTASSQVNTTFRRGDILLQEGELPFPNVMKIDVNDLEYEVLHGFSETLRNNQIRAIYVEIHSEAKQNRRGTKEEELYDLLEDCGYTITTFDDGKLDFHIKATTY